MKLLTLSTPTPDMKQASKNAHAYRMTGLYKEWMCHA